MLWCFWLVGRLDARRLIVRSSTRLLPSPKLQTFNIVGHREARLLRRNATGDGGAQNHVSHLLEARRSFFSRPIRSGSDIASGRVKFPLFKHDRGSTSRLQGSPHGLNPSDAGTDELHMSYFAASFCRVSSLCCVIVLMSKRPKSSYTVLPASIGTKRYRQPISSSRYSMVSDWRTDN
jgi:hypothetical protein